MENGQKEERQRDTRLEGHTDNLILGTKGTGGGGGREGAWNRQGAHLAYGTCIGTFVAFGMALLSTFAPRFSRMRHQ